MIYKIYSDLSSFKTLVFHRGFNLVLADKTAGASDKQTRNRAGKSSILDIIHFLLGSECEKDSVFRSKALVDVTFGMNFELDGQMVRVERTGARPTPLSVSGNSDNWPIEPHEKGGKYFISNENWKVVLEQLTFGLNDSSGSWGPSYRSLISYFVRRDRDGGMEQPCMNSRMQRPVNQQVNVSFLVGLDWSIAREWQKIREREKSLEQLKKGLGEGLLGHPIKSAASLKSELIVAEAQVRRLKSSLDSFKVVDQYHSLEREASSITSQLANLADENMIDLRYLAELERTTVEEAPPAPEDLEEMYKEAGVLLPLIVKKRFDEVKAFHESIVRNRRSYLQSEIDNTKMRIAERGAQTSKLDARRSDLMSVLKSAGALEHFIALQGELSKEQARAESVRQYYDTAEALEAGNLRLKVERAHLVERLRQDYTEQNSLIEEAVLTFRDISSQLYEDKVAGTLTVSPSENGPVFDPKIPGDKSKGVNNMRIFCFDMTLMLLCLKRNIGPRFLVHDSHLFDGVDERQVGNALAIGASLSEKYDFQYIVTMNTDSLPRNLPSGFNAEKYVINVRLTDASEDGGLFGFRFD